MGVSKLLNFEVVRDYGAKQIGSSCGIVAARVSSWLKESKPEANSDFMRLDTRGAVLATYYAMQTLSFEPMVNYTSTKFKTLRLVLIYDCSVHVIRQFK